MSPTVVLLLRQGVVNWLPDKPVEPDSNPATMIETQTLELVHFLKYGTDHEINPAIGFQLGEDSGSKDTGAYFTMNEFSVRSRGPLRFQDERHGATSAPAPSRADSSILHVNSYCRLLCDSLAISLIETQKMPDKGRTGKGLRPATNLTSISGYLFYLQTRELFLLINRTNTRPSL
jgi:hypothetical protein